MIKADEIVDHEDYNAAIIDARHVSVRRDNYKDTLNALDALWARLDKRMAPSGTLWVLARNWYDRRQRELLPFAYDITLRIGQYSTFKLKNTLAVYREMPPKNDGKYFAYGHFLIPFFVKSVGDYYFDKDSIREPHIFKGLEWVRRKRGKSGYGNKGTEKCRYNRKGHDPGNVFYRTVRNSEGRVLAIKEITDEVVYEKLTIASTKRDDTIASNIRKSSFQSLVARLGRKIARIDLMSK